MSVIGSFHEWADVLERRREEVVGILAECETLSVANVEVEKSIRALRTYDRELPAISDRQPVGLVHVCLPFNNPLYSLILYCCGPLLAGNKVCFRPSSLTSPQLKKLLSTFHGPLGALNLWHDDRSGSEFLKDAAEFSDCLIFTGTWNNVRDLRGRVKGRLIYCGPGLNPFAVLNDADMRSAVASSVKSRLFNSGQDCLCAERFYVASNRMDEFLETLDGALDKIRVGPEPDVDVGLLINRHSAERLEVLVNEPYSPPLPAARHALRGLSRAGRLRARGTRRVGAPRRHAPAHARHGSGRWARPGRLSNDRGDPGRSDRTPSRRHRGRRGHREPVRELPDATLDYVHVAAEYRCLGFGRTLVAAAVARAPSYRWTAPLPEGLVAQSFRARIAMRQPGQRCIHAGAVDLTR